MKWLLYLIVGMAVILIVILRKERQVKSTKWQNNFKWSIERILGKNQVMRYLVNQIAYSIYSINNKDIKQNIEYAQAVLLGIMVLTAVVLIYIILAVPVWYYALFWGLATLLGAYYLIFSIRIISKNHFTKQMPSLFNITADRIGDFNNIVHLLEYTLPDVTPTLQRDVVRLIDILKINDIGEMEYSFSFLKKVHDDNIFTTYLLLVKKANQDSLTPEIVELFQIINRKLVLEKKYNAILGSAAYTFILMMLLSALLYHWISKYFMDAFTSKVVEETINMTVGVIPLINIFMVFVILISVMLILNNQRMQ